MIPPFPFMGFPNNYTYNRQTKNQPIQNNNYDNNINKNADFRSIKGQTINDNTKEEQNFNFRSSNNFIDLFGIKLASDDLIILALLFFLYNEKVDDSFLFIALIMLLLS